MPGLTYSRTPLKICRGKVRCSGAAMNRVTTISSNEVAKANRPPEATPGKMIGSMTLRNAVSGGAPSEAAARARLVSKPSSVASTVMTTNGTDKAVCARIRPR